ncbi:EpsG family protein, partial [Paramylibacter ulvae]|uniref:EpsG family protein n=1 Tax=Paramylibacter ulvae TaxID=1651968 RepID=UPI00167C3472
LFAVFITSFISLGRALGTRNIVAAMIVVHLFVLFTLEFSTVRQLLATSLFNFALASYFNKQRIPLILFVASVLVQVSAAVYVIAFLFAIGAPRKIWLTTIVASAGALALNSISFLPYVLNFLPSFASVKLEYYFNDRDYSYNTLEQVFFAVFFIIVVLFANFAQSKVTKTDAIKQKFSSTDIALKLVLFLTLVSLAMFFVNTVRNRMLYELIILVSLIAFIPNLKYARYMRLVLFSFGGVYLAVSMTKSLSYMYVPYQNYIFYSVLGYESDGEERHKELQRFFRKQR